MKRIITFALCMVLLLTTLFGAGLYVQADSASPLVPRIIVKPGVEVEVNQEVFFSAENTTYMGKTIRTTDKKEFEQALYEWDFGDGYSVKYVGGLEDSAIATTHYYMRPGFFIAKLTVSIYTAYTDGKPTGTLIAKETETITISVTGKEPLDNFELLHAPFIPRIAQYVTADIPLTYINNDAYRLTVKLTGDNGTDITLFDKRNIDDTETFLLEQGKLNAGNYRVTATILDAQNKVVQENMNKRTQYGIWSEMFSKDYDGLPKVGIDENNAICRNGVPYFPVTPFTMNRDKYLAWENCIDTIYGTGWDTGNDLSVSVFETYIKLAAEKGFWVIGPSRHECFTARGSSYDFVAMREYIEVARESENMLMYDWRDEPNMGVASLRVSPRAMSAWKYLADEMDGQHPSFINFYSFDWAFNYEGKNYTIYDYVGSDCYNDRYTFFCDVISSDVYPLEFRRTKTLFNYINGPIALFVQSTRVLGEGQLNLLPQGVFIEVTEIEATGTPPPTDEQVLMQAWLGVTSGAVMINWFSHFYPDYKFAGMAEFNTAADTYERIILSQGREVEPIDDNSNVRANRVDTLTRYDGDDIYLFAVRLTEPDPMSGETISLLPENIEPETIETIFSVPQQECGIVSVLDEAGAVLRTIELKDGKFTDTFDKCEYHIYRITPADR